MTTASLTTSVVDYTKPDGVVVAGCSLNYFGSGSTWQHDGTSSLATNNDAEAWTVQHVPFNAFSSFQTEVTISGNGCDGTVMLCNQEAPLVTMPEPEVCRLQKTLELASGT